MLTEKMFSLALPDGAPERLASHCDVRGNGFPMMEGIGSAAFKRKSRLRELAIAAGAPPARLAPPTRFPSPPPFRGTPKSLDGELLVGPPRPGTRGKSLTPLRTPPSGQRLPATVDSQFARAAARAAEARRMSQALRDGIRNMQSTWFGELLMSDDLTYLMPGKPQAEGYDFSALDVIASYDDSCGNTGDVRWNGRSYGAVDTAAFYFNQCAANQSQSGPMWDIRSTTPYKPLVFEGSNNCVSWGPRATFADWQLTFRHGRMIDRHGVGGDITVEYKPARAGSPLPVSLPSLRVQSGFLPKWALKKWQRTSTDVEVGPEPRTRTRGERPLPPRPPGRYVRERKYRDDGAPTRFGRYHGSKIEKLFHWITEVDDAIDIAYDALSADVRAAYGCKGDLCKLNAIASNLDKMDWEKLGVDLVKNDIEDRLVGGAHGLAEGKGKPQNLGLGLGQFR